MNHRGTETERKASLSLYYKLVECCFFSKILASHVLEVLSLQPSTDPFPAVFRGEDKCFCFWF